MSSKEASAMPLSGYDIDEAYKVRSKMSKPGGLVDLEYGGYGIPLVLDETMSYPSKTVPIAARIPSGTVELLPGPYARWRVVRWIKIDPKYRRQFISDRKAARG